MLTPVQRRAEADAPTQRAPVSGRPNISAAHRDTARSWKSLATQMDRLIDVLLDEAK
jgi:hypothetical protein